MLQIKTSSWHYRLWRFGRESHSSQPRDLCRYFWHLALVKILIPATIATLALAGVAALIWVIWKNPLVAATYTLGGVVGIMILVGIVLMSKKQAEKKEDQLITGTGKPKVKKKPGLVRQFLKARKAKMCPLIQVVNDKDTSKEEQTA